MNLMFKVGFNKVSHGSIFKKVMNVGLIFLVVASELLYDEPSNVSFVLVKKEISSLWTTNKL